MEARPVAGIVLRGDDSRYLRDDDSAGTLFGEGNLTRFRE